MDRPEALPYDGPQGAGLVRRDGVDPVLWVSLPFALLCLTPTAWFRTSIGAHAFGPVAFTAIFAVVAVLFGFLGVFRGVELGDGRLRALSIAAIAVGFVRLFIFPMAGLY